MSLQSPNSSSISTDQEGQGKNPAAAFGPNEWLVDEIYQQYLQDPNSVDRAWWDFFADYKPGGATAPSQPAEGSTSAPAAPAQSSPAAPAAAEPKPAAEPVTPATPAASAPA
ncbi:2-oxoglutarate dehydrogenase E1 subunit family protein, partial [Streptomyces decoyicus]